jgi:hypothetical protein
MVLNVASRFSCWQGVGVSIQGLCVFKLSICGMMN